MAGTRDELVTAAAVVFDRDGYGRATVDRVCDLAGVTKGALYGHFSSKAELAAAVVDQDALEFSRTRERLQRLLRDPLQVLVDLGHLVPAGRDVAGRLLFSSPVCDAVAGRQFERWRTAVHDLLRAASYRGELLPGVDLDGTARGVVTSLVGARLLSMALAGPADGRVTALWRGRLPSVVRAEVLARLRLGPPPDPAP
ncbi:TetR family transcriptional regulator [Saccharothrix sp. Mg75]|uniref:TetR family transcriptional regulator n=1 Tax=Saccharothrix sp. Mg75 TaxID=3445357 RepID=UPI003EE92D52